MKINEFRYEVETFVKEKICPYTNTIDKVGRISNSTIQDIANKGYLGCNIPLIYGGSEYNSEKIGIINELFAKASPSVRSLFTVQGMVALAIQRYGTKEQKERWLPMLSSGTALASFALAEEQAGSDSNNIVSSYSEKGDSFVLNAEKVWVTFGQVANIFLVFAKKDEKYSAFIVDRGFNGVEVKAVDGLLGLRGSMVATLSLRDCEIPKENILGAPGSGLSYIAPMCLDYGRFTVAWGCVGICQECLDNSLEYVNYRSQFGNAIKDYQLIQRIITSMISMTKASRLMCESVNLLRDSGEPTAVIETCLAKYFASKAANDVASNAVQIFGANGCIDSYPIERFFRDSRINEIIEGTTQILEIVIAGNYSNIENIR